MENKKSNIDIMPILFRAIASGAIITIGAWRVGYGMDFGLDLNPMIERLICVVVMSVLFFAAVYIPKRMAEKKTVRWQRHLASAVLYAFVVAGVLYAFGFYTPTWAQDAVSAPIPPLWLQLGKPSALFAVIYFAANVVGDKMRGRDKEENSDD
ncbi:MAG: hypothetical protein IJ339_06920 [Oscillospiraceae bacterium]|nr:hypothetical protein [Oscillospiraceae bacterium]MBQ7817068.1 hypothetical protein [Oscillospiraceae bacterium]